MLVSVVVSVEYRFSFLDLVKSCFSFLTQLKCYSFEKPLLSKALPWTWPCGTASGILCLCRCSECLKQGIALPCLCNLVIVLSNSASHRDVFLNEWMRYVNWVVNLQVFKVIFLRFILFPLTWFSRLLLGTLDTKTGYFWKCCSDTFPSVLPTACFLRGH